MHKLLFNHPLIHLFIHFPCINSQTSPLIYTLNSVHFHRSFYAATNLSIQSSIRPSIHHLSTKSFIISPSFVHLCNPILPCTVVIQPCVCQFSLAQRDSSFLFSVITLIHPLSFSSFYPLFHLYTDPSIIFPIGLSTPSPFCIIHSISLSIHQSIIYEFHPSLLN